MIGRVAPQCSPAGRYKSFHWSLSVTFCPFCSKQTRRPAMPRWSCATSHRPGSWLPISVLNLLVPIKASLQKFNQNDGPMMSDFQSLLYSLEQEAIQECHFKEHSFGEQRNRGDIKCSLFIWKFNLIEVDRRINWHAYSVCKFY